MTSLTRDDRSESARPVRKPSSPRLARSNNETRELNQRQILFLQRLAGNQSVTGLLQTMLVAQRETAAPPASATATATPAATTPPAAPASYPEIDALDLQPKAKNVATELKKKYSQISFTSGKRDADAQASAMAANVVQDRTGYLGTYKATDLAKQLQDWVDKHPEAKTQADIAKGLKSVMDTWSNKDLLQLSKHLTGEAFDMQPIESDKQAADIKKDAKAWAQKEGGEGSDFLEKEGKLTRWHTQVFE
ncbi:MAG: hypothetical protein E6I56_12520 [Chloroflexi bacterium]|nr:MAG: hypothetical protein E6I56_12520 [Chloroflexota bacterium]